MPKLAETAFLFCCQLNFDPNTMADSRTGVLFPSIIGLIPNLACQNVPKMVPKMCQFWYKNKNHTSVSVTVYTKVEVGIQPEIIHIMSYRRPSLVPRPCPGNEATEAHAKESWNVVIQASLPFSIIISDLRTQQT